MIDWIIEGMRTLLWALASAGLELMDICYDIVVNIASADFLRDKTVWQWYGVLMIFMGSLILIRGCSVYFKLAFDEEYAEKVSGFNFIQNLVKIALVIAFLPPVLGFVGQVSSWGVQNLSVVLGTTSTDKPSTLIITSFMNTDNGEYDANGNWVSGEKVTYKLEDVDINADGEGEDEFKFFNEMSDLFLLLFIGLASAALLIINGIQIGGRMYSIVIKLLIAPLPISSLIVPGDETFTMWRKMILSDYLLNYIQTLMLAVVMILSGSKILTSMGVWVQIISLISGFFMLLKGIPELSKILGGDTSQGGMLQQIASFRQASAGLAKAGVSAVSTGLNMAGATASAATKGAGFLADKAGINFMNDIKASLPKNLSGFMGGSKVKEQNQTYANTGFDGTKENAANPNQEGFSGTQTQEETENKTNAGVSDFSQQGTQGGLSGQSGEFQGDTGNQTFAPTSGGNHMYQQKQQQLNTTRQVRYQSTPDITKGRNADTNMPISSPELAKGRR